MKLTVAMFNSCMVSQQLQKKLWQTFQYFQVLTFLSLKTGKIKQSQDVNFFFDTIIWWPSIQYRHSNESIQSDLPNHGYL